MTLRSAESARAEGLGSTVNGGELLCLALATCSCNDLHREATARGVSDAPADAIEALLAHTDRVAEVHDTLRGGIAVERRGSPTNAR